MTTLDPLLELPIMLLAKVGIHVKGDLAVLIKTLWAFLIVAFFLGLVLGAESAEQAVRPIFSGAEVLRPPSALGL